MSTTLVKGFKKQLKKIVHPTVRTLKPAPDLPTEPLSTKWGSDRGTPIDLHFINRFVEGNSHLVTGKVLEIKNRKFTNEYGQNVTTSDVLDIDPENPDANVIADLAAADNVPDNSYDCFILTETLHLIYDFQSAIKHSHRFLKPGGTLLLTVPTLSPMDTELSHLECWRFTKNSCTRMLQDAFVGGQVEVEAYGNYFSCSAFLTGLAKEEVDESLLQETSPTFIQGIVCRATKAES